MTAEEKLKELYEVCRELLDWYDGIKTGRGLATKCIEHIRRQVAKGEYSNPHDDDNSGSTLLVI